MMKRALLLSALSLALAGCGTTTRTVLRSEPPHIPPPTVAVIQHHTQPHRTVSQPASLPPRVDVRRAELKAIEQATLERERWELNKVHAEEHQRQLAREQAEQEQENCTGYINGKPSHVECKTGPHAFGP